VATALSLSDLIVQGEHDEHPHAPQGREQAGPLQWLGLAVGELPYLLSSARTVDDINWRSSAPNAAHMHVGLIDALSRHLANSAALLHHALVAHHRAHPELGDTETALTDVDFLSHALVEDHPPLWRRFELLEGGYVTALAAAVQASGLASDAGAAVVDDALTRALATLLGHARLNARDREIVESRKA
jgi:hypothetical protein